MPTLPPATTLRPGQTRVINASEGVTIQVLQGRLWVTRPDDRQDHFLTSGQDMLLTDQLVVVEPDHPAGPGPLCEVRYVLLPQSRQTTSGQRETAPSPAVHTATADNRLRGWGQLLGWVRRGCLSILSSKKASTA